MGMKQQDAKLLKRFQCDYNRTLEETFAQTLAENEAVRLFFINENQAFTDGRNIVVDPATDELFADRDALDQTGDFLGWSKVVLSDAWSALRIITRAQTIHECLHLLYTDFPGRHASDPACDTHNKKLVMGMISNIIEDAYIEAVGCSYFDHMDFYLKFGRISRLFANHPGAGTVDRAFGKMAAAEKNALQETPREITAKIPERTDPEKLIGYLNYMVTFLLYPMVRQELPTEDIAPYVEASKQIFLNGSVAPSPAERYDCSTQAFALVAHLIPEDTEPLELEEIASKLGGTKTHRAEGSTISGEHRAGKTQEVSTRLFTDRQGNEKENVAPVDELVRVLRSFAKEKATAEKLMDDSGSFVVLSGKDYECAAMHKHIKINERHPKIDPNLRTAYQNIYDRYKINIRSYAGRFKQILATQAPQREEKRLFGNGITSTRLGDPKKRYWYQTIQGEDAPDLAVMLLIDGSGSMSGAREKAAMHAAIILHEVLKKQGIPHAVVEHRAGGPKPEIDVNILVSFHSREEEKLNLMQLGAYGDNRDGLALFWAERYMAKHTRNDDRLIIVLSDGVPAHHADGYYPPVSTKDTANAVKKITRRGTDIIGVSLDQPGSFATYEQLSQIYPNLVACNDLSRLTGQILGIIAKLLRT